MASLMTFYKAHFNLSVFILLLPFLLIHAEKQGLARMQVEHSLGNQDLRVITLDSHTTGGSGEPFLQKGKVERRLKNQVVSTCQER